MLSISTLKDAEKVVRDSALCVRTPLLKHCESLYNLPNKFRMSFKLENMQNYGSFKIRGIANQFHCASKKVMNGESIPVTMSAGNYGKAFAAACSHFGIKGHVLMPQSAPDNRQTIIEGYGLTVERAPTADLMNRVNQHVKHDNMIFMHSYDDLSLIAGHASSGLEIMEDMPDVDIVVVCCGGGGYLAGIASAVKNISPNCKVFGVEPQKACTMYESFRQGKAVEMSEAASVASGLAPPSAGKQAYEICKSTVEGIVLLTEDELKTAVKTLYNRGLVVEPAGSAAFAAVLFNKIPDVGGKNVVVVISGGNVTPQELLSIIT